jgi:hypothetical protein
MWCENRSTKILRYSAFSLHESACMMDWEPAGSAGVSRLPQGPENHTHLPVRQVHRSRYSVKIKIYKMLAVRTVWYIAVVCVYLAY